MDPSVLLERLPASKFSSATDFSTDVQDPLAAELAYIVERGYCLAENDSCPVRIS